MYKNIPFLKITDVFALRSIKYNLEPHKTEFLKLTLGYPTDPYFVFM